MLAVLHGGQEGSTQEKFWALNVESEVGWGQWRPQSGHYRFYPVPESNLREDLFWFVVKGRRAIMVGKTDSRELCDSSRMGLDLLPAHTSMGQEAETSGAWLSTSRPPPVSHFLP